jgi:tetratricopeptide (TPR) repeat protein
MCLQQAMWNFNMSLDIIEKLCGEGKLSEAFDVAKAMLAKGETAEAWHCLGCVQSSRKDYEWAIQSFKKAIEIDPNYTAALCNLVYIYDHFKLYQDSNEANRRCRAIVPDVKLPKLWDIVYIGIPTYGLAPINFTMSLVALIMATTPEDRISYMICPCIGSRIASNRNRLAADALKRGATHIMFIDNDMMFPPDAIKRLLSYNKDIVCATACKRGDDDGVPIGTAIGKKEGDEAVKVSTGSGLIEMSLVGSCFMLIKSEVFANIAPPLYYEPANPPDGDAFGEDITFCKIVRNNGYQIWMDFDLSIQLGHIGEKVYYIQPAKE